MTNFEKRIRDGISIIILGGVMFIGSEIYSSTKEIPVIVNKIDYLIESDNDFSKRLDDLQSLVYNNDKKISIIESKK